VVEVQAALCTGEFCCDLGLHDTILEDDFSQVVNVVNAFGPNWCRYGQLVVDIQMVLSTWRVWQIRHICRVANFVAHGLAKAAIKQIMIRVWTEEIFESIRDVVAFEQCAHAY
jgi:hypothetical protein